MSSNPYAPPSNEPFVPPAEEGVVNCVVQLTEENMGEGLSLTAGRSLIALPIGLGVGGFIGGTQAGFMVQALLAVVGAAVGWFLSTRLFRNNARRALANKSEAERTVRWRFSQEGYEITTVHSHVRSDWATIHRFLEGPKS